MRKLNLNIMYFSPTGSSAKIARAIADGMELEYKEYDLTYNRNIGRLDFGLDDILIVSVPVYAGRVPEILLDVFDKIKSEKSFFLPVVVYGNRAIEDALIELNDIFNNKGFITVGFGIFIGEHSYSSEFATGRPNEEDLEVARNYGKTLIHKINTIEDREKIFDGVIPGSRPYKERPAQLEEWGPVANDNCTFCGDCLSKCPVDAIQHLNPKKTDYSKCIHCCACIKVCKEDAKHIEGQTVSKVMDMLKSVAVERKEILLG